MKEQWQRVDRKIKELIEYALINWWWDFKNPSVKVDWSNVWINDIFWDTHSTERFYTVELLISKEFTDAIIKWLLETSYINTMSFSRVDEDMFTWFLACAIRDWELLKFINHLNIWR